MFLAAASEDKKVSVDILTIVTGFASFGIFLLVHVITFRWISPEGVLKSLMTMFIAFMGLPLMMTGMLFALKLLSVSWQTGACMAVLAGVIHGLLCFVYVICVFGFYEASVRMRLVREIVQAKPGGILMEEILQHYNPDEIVRLRLRRLMGSGDIIERQGFYRVAGHRNFFFLFDMISGILKKWIKIS